MRKNLLDDLSKKRALSEDESELLPPGKTARCEFDFSDEEQSDALNKALDDMGFLGMPDIQPDPEPDLGPSDLLSLSSQSWFQNYRITEGATESAATVPSTSTIPEEDVVSGFLCEQAWDPYKSACTQQLSDTLEIPVPKKRVKSRVDTAPKGGYCHCCLQQMPESVRSPACAPCKKILRNSPFVYVAGVDRKSGGIVSYILCNGMFFNTVLKNICIKKQELFLSLRILESACICILYAETVEALLAQIWQKMRAHSIPIVWCGAPLSDHTIRYLNRVFERYNGKNTGQITNMPQACCLSVEHLVYALPTFDIPQADLSWEVFRAHLLEFISAPHLAIEMDWHLWWNGYQRKLQSVGYSALEAIDQEGNNEFKKV